MNKDLFESLKLYTEKESLGPLGWTPLLAKRKNSKAFLKRRNKKINKKAV